MVKNFFMLSALRLYRRYLKNTLFGEMLRRLNIKYGVIKPFYLEQLTKINLNNSIKSLNVLSSKQSTEHNEDSSAFLGVSSETVEASSSVPGFHYSPPLNFEVSDTLTNRPCINFILPSLLTKHMSGGPNTALLFAIKLTEKGERVRLIACDVPAFGKEAELYPHMDSLIRRPVQRDLIELVDAFDRHEPCVIGVNDLFFATAWWTAQIARYALEKTRYKTFIYLIQDYEPILHNGCTLQARAEETYGLSHIPLINTRLLLDHLIK